MATTCSFVGAELPRTFNRAIPTFYIDSSNTNYLQDTGSFVDQYSSVCSFPTMYGLLSKNTLTPYVVNPGKTTTLCSNGGLLPGIALATNGMVTYNQYACPTITYNQMATGTWTVGFTEATGPAFTPQSFVIAGPPTTTTDVVYATITATALTTAGPNTTTILVTTGAGGAASTSTMDGYSATSISTIYVTPISQTSTVYMGPDTSTITLPAQPSSTTTLTQYLDTSPISSVSSPSLSPTSLPSSSSFLTSFIPSASIPFPTTFTSPSSSLTSIVASTSSASLAALSSSSSFFTSITLPASSASPTTLSSSPSLLTSINISAPDIFSSFFLTSPRSPSASTVTLSSSASFLASSAPTISSSLSYSTSHGSSSSSRVTSFSISTMPSSPSLSSSTHSSSSMTTAATPLATFTCPTSDKATFTARSGQLFQAVCYKDFQAQQIGVIYVQSFSGCIQACDSTSGCLAVSWTGSSGAGYCYLKGQNTISVTSTSVWGAKVISNQTQYTCPDSNGESFNAPNGTVYTIECYLDRVANSMVSSFQPSFESCITSCEATSGCLDVSWLPSGQCYLKSAIMPAASNVGVWGATKGAPSPTTSATKTTAIAVATICPNGYSSGAPMACPAADGICYKTSSNDTFQVACYSDATGGDLGSSWNPSFESCLDTCSNTTGCVDVSYEYRGTGNRICYMKSSITTPISNSAVYGASRVATHSASSAGTSTVLTKRALASLPGPDYTYPNLPTVYMTNTSVISATITMPASTVATVTQYTAANPSGVTTITQFSVLSSITTITLPASTYTVTYGISSTVNVTITPSPSGVSTVTMTQSGPKMTSFAAAATSTSSIS